MSEQVKALTDVVKDVATVKKMAADVAVEMRQNIADVTEGLLLAKEMSGVLKDAGSELRGALGLGSNHPPREGEAPKTGQEGNGATAPKTGQ